MSVLNAIILTGPTISVTDGTAKAYTPGGQKVNDGINIVDTTATDYRSRQNISLRAKEPVIDKAGTVSVKATRHVTVTHPKVLASGAIDFPCGEVKLKIHPENSDAETLALKQAMVQVILGSDFDNFWKFGSLQ